MRILLLVAATLAATADAGRLASQERPVDPLEASVRERLDTYNRALERLEQAQADFRGFDAEIWEPLNAQYALALGRGDDRESDRFLGEIQHESQRRTELQSAETAAEREWERAAQSLISHVDSYLDDFVQRTSRGDTSVDLQGQYEYWYNILTEVEARLEQHSPLELGPLPEVRALADDTPADLEGKALVLENRATVDSLLVADLEDRIATERRRWQRQLDYEDWSIRNRQTEPPVGATTGVAGSADSVAVDLTQTPQQRIESMQSLREEYIARIEQLRERARTLRLEAERRRG